jgi:hypothetical protein
LAIIAALYASADPARLQDGWHAGAALVFASGNGRWRIMQEK